MIKAFYKKSYRPKVYFNKNMIVRSMACGNDVLESFLQWEKYFLEQSERMGGKFVLSAQADIRGTAFDRSDKMKRILSADLPTLHFEAFTFEVGQDGWVMVDGAKSALHLGTEIKAWAILTVPSKSGAKSALCVIAKPLGCQTMRLTAYELSKRGVSSKQVAYVNLQTTLNAKSHLICLGQHVLIVHNSILDYYYLHFERKELQRVAIGEDGDNQTFKWCKFVEHCTVCDSAGRVFWISESDVYGIRIGSPRRLIQLSKADSERTLHIQCKNGDLLVYRKDINSGNLYCVRYQDTEYGTYEGSLINPNNLV